MEGTLSEYIPNSWFHPVGIHKALKRILPRMPDLSGKLFITLTVDPKSFRDEESGFDHSRDKIRRIFHRLRKGVHWEGETYRLRAPYAVKLEFQENGWPHYHIVFLTNRFLPYGLVSHMWGLGWIEVERIKSDEFNYLLKYITKAQELPEWVLHKRRIRVFQSSRGFLLPLQSKSMESHELELRPRKKRAKEASLGDRLQRWSEMGKFENKRGIVQSVRFKCAFRKIFDHLIFDIAQDGRYMGNGKIEIRDSKEILLWEMKARQLNKNQECSSLDW